MNTQIKRWALAILIGAGVLILGGILLLVLLVPIATSTLYRVCLIIISILCILMGAGLLYILFLARDNDPNFFLYDKKSGRNIDPDELTFDRVNSRMSYFLTTLTTSQEKLWSDHVLDASDDKFGFEGVYRPLTAYKMLYDLIEIDSPDGWRLFICASPACIVAMTDALAANGEDAMVQSLRHAYNNAANRDDYEWVRDFVKGNEKYIRRRMLAYVKKNMERFY